MLAVPRNMLAAPHDVSAPCDMLATQDTYGNSRGLEGPSGGLLYMKNFYGLELLKKSFLDQKIVINDPPESDNYHFFIFFLKPSLREGLKKKKKSAEFSALFKTHPPHPCNRGKSGKKK